MTSALGPRSTLAVTLAIGLGVLAESALAPAPAAALGCNHRLVTVGDSAHYVRQMCGEPASAITRTETRTQIASWGSPSAPGAITATSVTVQVDVWVYDFGPRRFMEELTFENGTLRSMRALGYGTRAGREERRGAILRAADRGLAHSSTHGGRSPAHASAPPSARAIRERALLGTIET